MKKIYIVGGTMGVGKTAVCQSIKRKLLNAVFLDGDWCWDADPFQVNDETKTMVMQNITYLLNQFLHCTAYENVIFCWVMHQQEIIDAILSSLDKSECEVKVISLICNPKTLEKRLEKDIHNGLRAKNIVERSMDRLPLYSKLNTIKISTDNKSIDEISDYIITL